MPKAFKDEHGQYTSSTNKMLDMLTSYMEDVYNVHQREDLPSMIQNFQEKYSQTMEDMSASCHLPQLTFQQVWEFAQTRSPSRAAGMDAWGMDELLHLPPSGWIGFTMTMLLAEETGQWPLVLKFISLSAIGKGTDIKSPKDTRCIGVSSCVYSVWSGLRFRHLIPWMLRVFPSNIIGGVPERHMFESEAQLSLDIRDFQTEPLLVLLDRVKCFDRIVPAVAVFALNSLGLPPPIGVAIQGFYSNQVRIMKLGKAFGNRLIHGSSALQGCTLSILMVNGIFSVLMAHLNKTCPQVQATTFIDDMKVWAKRENIGMLQSALAETVEFDRLTGQLISEEKNNCCK